jgi:hypothetical protein
MPRRAGVLMVLGLQLDSWLISITRLNHTMSWSCLLLLLLFFGGHILVMYLGLGPSWVRGVWSSSWPKLILLTLVYPLSTNLAQSTISRRRSSVYPSDSLWLLEVWLWYAPVIWRSCCRFLIFDFIKTEGRSADNLCFTQMVRRLMFIEGCLCLALYGFICDWFERNGIERGWGCLLGWFYWSYRAWLRS